MKTVIRVNQKTTKFTAMALTATALAISLVGCGKKSSNDTAVGVDASSSELVASTVGGSIAASDGTGSQTTYMPKKANSLMAQIKASLDLIPKAYANALCPTLGSGGAECSASGNTATLSYNSCSFFVGGPVWNGAQYLTFSSISPACGTWPSTSSGSLLRTFKPGTTRTSAFGVAVSLDTSTATGYSNPVSGGIQINYNSASQRTITIPGVNIKASWGALPIFDHTISSSGVTVSILGNQRTANGTVTVQHNLAASTGTSTLTNLVHTTTCCTPVSGSISTSFSGGKLDGKSESLVFNSCGLGTFTNVNGQSSTVTLSHCF